MNSFCKFSGAIILATICTACIFRETPLPSNGTTNQADRIIDYSGKRYEQGVPYYSETSPDSCFYDIYVSLDYIEDNGLYEGEYCKRQCDQTGGRKRKFISLNKRDSDGNTYIYAIRCQCNKCSSSKSGSFDFNIVKTNIELLSGTKCRKFGDNNRIELRIRNTGQKDITKEDWIVHKIDGIEVDVDRAFSAHVQETGTVFSVVQNQQPNLKSGEHIIELGLPNSDTTIITVTCP